MPPQNLQKREGKDMSEAIIEKRRGISPVWILPILAICLGGWLLFKSHRDAGIDITVRVDNSSGITADKTPVRFLGNQIGTVKNLNVSSDLQGVNLTIEMKKTVEPYLVEDLKFWIEKVDVEAGRISGLGTLLSGSYIGMQLGTSKKQARKYIALPHRPPLPENAPGLHLSLKADALHSIEIGSAIYHKNISVGNVQKFALQEDDSVLIGIHIKPEYQDLVKKDTRFWNASGITISGGITDLKIHIASLSSIIKGGIMMQTPSAVKDSPQAENGQAFPLYDGFEEAEYGIPMTLELLSGEGIKEGATQVKYRGMKIGVIKELNINKDEHHSVTAHVLLDPRAESILRENTEFYLVRPEISLKGVRNLDTIIMGSHITFIPGEGAFTDHFIVKTENSLQQKTKVEPGDLEMMLTAKDLASIDVGSPILYKKITVGEITGFKLREKNDDVLLTAVIKKQYAGLVKTTSRFYNLSGVEVNASLSGIKIQTGSLETIVAGGVAFYTPGKGKTAAKDQVYSLYDDHEAAENSARIKATIHFARTEGLKKGVLVKYNGIEIGKVSKVHYEKDMETITVEAMLEKKAGILLKETTRFWLVRPEFSLSGTQHLDTLLGGPYIAIEPGKGASRLEYTALQEEPAIVAERPGLNVVLETDDLFSLKPGDHVYYRRVKVGEVTGVHLSSTFQKVLLNVIIDKPFVSLIRKNTKFWNASGVHVSGGIFSGVSVSTESLEGLLAGGIALATPNNDKMGLMVKDGHSFTLYGEAKDSWLKWSPEIRSRKPDRKKRARRKLDTSDD
ncbi:MAG: MCE family protein [Desulfobulbaceae bacterium]|nr:MCE family protein [Desulfobulbaceae bacterium]